MKNKITRVNIVLMITSLLAGLNIVVFIFRFIRGECLFVDFRARWQETAYLFHGVNPFDALAGKVTIDSIGVIDPDMVTVPWAWALSFFINPGFLPYEAARTWGMIVYFMVCTITSIVCYRYVKENYFQNVEDTKKWSLTAVFIVLGQYCWVWSFMCGNHGALACCFVIIALCIYKKHPIGAGVLMAIGMIKPQVAVLFYITFLLLKQYKVIITSAIIGLAVMIMTCGITGAGFFELLQGTSQVGTNLEGVFFGLFNMMKYAGVPTNIVLGLDIVVGLIYLLVVTWYSIKYNNAKNDLAVFMGAAIASTFWFYKQSHDFVILILPCLVLLAGMDKIKDKYFIKNTMLLFFYISIFYFQSILRKLTCMITGLDTQIGKELFMTFTAVVFIIMGILMVKNEENI